MIHRPGDRPTILVVDDMPVNIAILTEALENDYHICFATNGREALELAERLLPDLILLDVLMPDLSGLEVCEELKEDPLLKEIPVIFLTGLSEQEHEIAGLTAGAVDYITKPFHPQVVRLRVATQLELKRLREKYAQLALLDGLTGIPNRRAFDDHLHREWLRLERSKGELSLLLMDIDHFKLYNDSLGHLEGDECLRQVAHAVHDSLRGTDFAARFGGEEFACVLHGAGHDGAEVTAERIRSGIQALGIPHPASPTARVITVSIGGATLVPSREYFPERLVNLADQMLYCAKQAGRNLVKLMPEGFAAGEGCPR
ncbi:diguanylate cyclase [Geomonas sp. Red32]|uniref:diguanylate cyclase domain-containing protein n=1 Tax=Geomonas sp. Red32 TaxID=2912856 RepID=UPI00202CD0FC|nr:diguanylate cyclase [Geomonas sp. Red32]MCM0082131.1 diguanylate cyclase [Geomonas sp. Red32]